MTQRSAAVVLALDGFAPTSGVITVIDRTAHARIGRAVLALVVSWLGAFVCIFIPLLHFVLVPTLLVAGIVMFVLRLKEARSLYEVRGRCPRCATERVYAPGGRFYDGRAFHCDGCGEQPRLSLRRDDSAQ